jgi:hypothetical protein
LLCRHHGGELEIPLYPAHRFLNRDYNLFDCGGMASSEAGFQVSIAIVMPVEKRRPGSLGGAGRAEGRNWFVKLKL